MPAIIGMTVTSTYNLVDALFVGQGAGTQGLAALTAAFPVQMLFMAVAQTVGMGAASIISRALGSGAKERAIAFAGTAMSLVTLLGLALTAIGLLFEEELLVAFGARGDVLKAGAEYLGIVIPASSLFCFSVAANALIRSEGSQRTAMTSLIIGAATNLVLDPILIFGFDMGLRGAAWATVVGYVASFVFQLWYFRSSRTMLKVRASDLVPRIRYIREILAIGSAAFARNVASSIFSVVANNSIISYGSEEYLAIFGVAVRVLMLMLMPLFGLVQALQPIVGFNFGAGNFARVNTALKTALVWATGWSLFCFAIFELFARQIMASFDPNPAVQEVGAEVFRVIVLASPFVGFQVVAASFFQHIGKAGPALVLSMSRQLLFLIPLILLLPVWFDLWGVWAAFPLADLLSAVVTAGWLVWAIRGLVRQAGQGAVGQS